MSWHPCTTNPPLETILIMSSAINVRNFIAQARWFLVNAPTYLFLPSNVSITSQLLNNIISSFFKLCFQIILPNPSVFLALWKRHLTTRIFRRSRAGRNFLPSLKTTSSIQSLAFKEQFITFSWLPKTTGQVQIWSVLSTLVTIQWLHFDLPSSTLSD